MDYKLGTIADGVESMSDLFDGVTPPIANPRPTYKTSAQRVLLASGAYRGMGLPQVTWHFDVMTTAMRDWLRGYCAGESADVFLQTRINDHDTDGGAAVFKAFRGQMTWPEEEDIESNSNLNFDITFTQLIEQVIYP